MFQPDVIAEIKRTFFVQ